MKNKSNKKLEPNFPNSLYNTGYLKHSPITGYIRSMALFRPSTPLYQLTLVSL